MLLTNPEHTQKEQDNPLPKLHTQDIDSERRQARTVLSTSNQPLQRSQDQITEEAVKLIDSKNPSESFEGLLQDAVKILSGLDVGKKFAQYLKENNIKFERTALGEGLSKRYAALAEEGKVIVNVDMILASYMELRQSGLGREQVRTLLAKNLAPMLAHETRHLEIDQELNKKGINWDVSTIQNEASSFVAQALVVEEMQRKKMLTSDTGDISLPNKSKTPFTYEVFKTNQLTVYRMENEGYEGVFSLTTSYYKQGFDFVKSSREDARKQVLQSKAVLEEGVKSLEGGRKEEVELALSKANAAFDIIQSDEKYAQLSEYFVQLMKEDAKQIGPAQERMLNDTIQRRLKEIKEYELKGFNTGILFSVLLDTAIKLKNISEELKKELIPRAKEHVEDFKSRLSHTDIYGEEYYERTSLCLELLGRNAKTELRSTAIKFVIDQSKKALEYQESKSDNLAQWIAGRMFKFSDRWSISDDPSVKESLKKIEHLLKKD